MTNPWDGPRHRSWASDTVLTFLLLVVCIIAVGVSDYVGEPPSYLVGLLGTSAGAFFAALGSDKQKRNREVETTLKDTQKIAERAEAKADAGLAVAEVEHPETARQAEQNRATAEAGRVIAEDDRVEAEVQRRVAEELRRRADEGGEGG